MIVKDERTAPISAPTNLEAKLADDHSNATLSWQAPAGVDTACYIIYRDGALFATVKPYKTTWTDNTLLPGTNTRYHVSAINTNGDESIAEQTEPAIVRTAMTN